MEEDIQNYEAAKSLAALALWVGAVIPPVTDTMSDTFATRICMAEQILAEPGDAAGLGRNEAQDGSRQRGLAAA